MARTDYIGLRIARYRDLAGLTQQQLADAVGITKPYVSMIERGKRPVTKRSMLGAFASALGVDMMTLAGQPEQPRTLDDLAIYRAVPAIRSALDDEPGDGPVDATTLTARIDEAMRARMQCEYRTLSALLPSLIAESRRLAATGDDRGLRAFVRVGMTASLAIKPFGWIDLSARLAERTRLAADMLGDPVERAAAVFAVAQVALSTDTRGGSLRSLTAAARAAAELGDDGDDETLSWYGLLHLQAALAAGSLARADDVATHYGEAESAVRRVHGDPWRMEFTQANVCVWRVGISVENGEPDRAPEYARRVDRAALRSANRRCRLHIDTGRGYYAAGDQANAVRQFLAADAVSPTELRSRPSVRELVGQMVRDARRRGSAELQDLAVRVGVDPLDPDLS